MFALLSHTGILSDFSDTAHGPGNAGVSVEVLSITAPEGAPLAYDPTSKAAVEYTGLSGHVADYAKSEAEKARFKQSFATTYQQLRNASTAVEAIANADPADLDTIAELRQAMTVLAARESQAIRALLRVLRMLAKQVGGLTAPADGV